MFQGYKNQTLNQRVEDNFFGQVHQLMMPNQVLENKKLMCFHAIIPFSTLIRGYRRLQKATKRGIRDVRWTMSKVFTQDMEKLTIFK